MIAGGAAHSQPRVRQEPPLQTREIRSRARLIPRGQAPSDAFPSFADLWDGRGHAAGNGNSIIGDETRYNSHAALVDELGTCNVHVRLRAVLHGSRQ